MRAGRRTRWRSGCRAQRFERVVYLGSNELRGLALEAALKLLELTDGRTVAVGDSALGFRHGPKTIINGRTLVVVFQSNDSYTRAYDGICSPNCAAMPARAAVLALGARGDSGDSTRSAFEGVDRASDIEVALLSVLVAQSYALRQSLTLGLTPDRPNAAGVVNRVVQGVTIHPWRGTRSMYLGVDGGGTKTAYALIDADGRLRATPRRAASATSPAGWLRPRRCCAKASSTVLAKGNLRPADVVVRILRIAILRRGQRHDGAAGCDAIVALRRGEIPLRKRHDLQLGRLACLRGTA